MGKTNKSLYIEESAAKMIEKLAEKYNTTQGRVVEEALKRLNDEGMPIPSIRFGKKGLIDKDN